MAGKNWCGCDDKYCCAINYVYFKKETANEFLPGHANKINLPRSPMRCRLRPKGKDKWCHIPLVIHGDEPIFNIVHMLGVDASKTWCGVPMEGNSGLFAVYPDQASKVTCKKCLKTLLKAQS